MGSIRDPQISSSVNTLYSNISGAVAVEAVATGATGIFVVVLGLAMISGAGTDVVLTGATGTGADVGLTGTTGAGTDVGLTGTGATVGLVGAGRMVMSSSGARTQIGAAKADCVLKRRMD